MISMYYILYSDFTSQSQSIILYIKIFKLTLLSRSRKLTFTDSLHLLREREREAYQCSGQW